MATRAYNVEKSCNLDIELGSKEKKQLDEGTNIFLHTTIKQTHLQEFVF